MTASRTTADPAPVRVAWGADDRWTGRDLLIAEASRWTSVPVAALSVTSSCPRCGSSTHGRPFLRAASSVAVPHVSLSRAPGMVVVALTQAGPVGVDVERADAASFAGFAEVALDASERADLTSERTRTWVRKESLVKAAGRGLATDLRQLRVTDPGQPPGLLAWDDWQGLSDWSGSPVGGMWMFDVVGPVGYVVGVSILSLERPALVARPAAAVGPSGAATP